MWFFDMKVYFSIYFINLSLTDKLLCYEFVIQFFTVIGFDNYHCDTSKDSIINFIHFIKDYM